MRPVIVRYPRYSARLVEEALADTPAVFVMGARQVGKTTLVKDLIDPAWQYITFDDLAQAELARADPVGFIRNLPPKRVALDEVQRVPDTLIAIKQAVDENRTPGRFLLTGSANALLLPRVSDALVGRMEAVRLATLSECEIIGHRPAFLEALLLGEVPTAEDLRVRDHLVRRIVTGCFPEPLLRGSEKRGRAWHRQYLNTLIQRDLSDLRRIGNVEAMSRLLRLTAVLSGQLVNLAALGGRLGLNRITADRYLALLEQLFLVERLPAWHASEYRRLVKTPKMHAVDTGMICALRGITRRRLLRNPAALGSLLESFVYNELRKQALWMDDPLTFHHYRDKDKVEVDLVLEDAAGDCYGVEVKAAASLRPQDFTGLRRLRRIAGDRFRMGVLLYDGDHTTSFGDRLFAVPVGALWS
ncbi:MAG: ATP-binding protein [Gemmatimonadetes bacterium]|nr:ATP-binding protein [Gemmatimonadota bacterium]